MISPIQEKLLISVAIVVMAILLIVSIRHESITWDESLHVPAGLSYWQARDLRLNPEHPPLLKMWSTLPLMLRKAELDFSGPEWAGARENESARSFFQLWNSNIESVVFWARLPMVLLTLVLALSVLYMARALGGPLGGLLSLSFFVTAPFFLAYGPLVLTDIGLTLFVCLTLWTFGSLWRDASPKTTANFAIALSGAMLSKFSVVLLFPAIALAAVALLAVEMAHNRAALTSFLAPNIKRLRALAIGTVAAFGIVYLFYFVTGYRGLASVVLGSRYTSVRSGYATKIVDYLRQHPVVDRFGSPVVLYLSGMRSVFLNWTRGLTFLGHFYPRGQWFYFPLMFLFKMTPGFIGALLLLAALLGKYLFSQAELPPIAAPQFKCHSVCLSAGLVVFAGGAIFSPITLAIRHFSVPIALLMILLSLVIPLMATVISRSARAALCAIVLLLVVSTAYSCLKTFPAYIPYYNVFIGRQPKFNVSGDSNLDWGQSLPSVREFSQTHSGKIVFDYYGVIDSRTYAPSVMPWKCNSAVPYGSEWALVSASWITTLDCSYLRSYPYSTLDGGTVLVFHNADDPIQVPLANPRRPDGISLSSWEDRYR